MIKYCLFPVAGFGTRFLPVTKTVPKELLPILDKPLLQYALDEAYESGCTEMILVTNKFKTSIQDYFRPFPYLESIVSIKQKNKLSCIQNITDNCSLSFVNQEEMLGLGHAIFQGRKIIGDNAFAVVLPDDLCHNKDTSVLRQLKDIYSDNPNKCIIAVEEVKNQEVEKYGVISGKPILDNSNLYQVDDLIEKPSIDEAPSNLAIIGRYIFSQEIFDILQYINPGKNGEIQITDALRELAKDGKVIALKFEGKRIDCGSVEGYLEGNIFFSSIV